MPRQTPIITLTTDFGYRDQYVGAMKAVILSHNRDVHLVDITHEIPPQDIMAAAWILKNAAFLYPDGTVHLTVVDPGVGTARNPLIVRIGGQLFVGPDNGLFSLLAEDAQVEAWHIKEPRFMRETISGTFHGRDIFAPVAAHLASGTPPGEFGEMVDDIVRFRWSLPISDNEGVQGWVIHIDTYGNLITNITSGLLERLKGQKFRIYAGTTILGSIHHTFADVADGEPAAIVGSAGTLEIVVNKGCAAELLSVNKGAQVSIILQKQESPAKG